MILLYQFFIYRSISHTSIFTHFYYFPILLLSLLKMDAKPSSCALLPTQSVIVESTTVTLSEADEDGRSEQRTCRVCGHLSHGYHFGILACRACAAFFRRTVVEKKSYRCRQSGQCEIRKEMRNMCRSCRFDLCLRLGMNKDDVQMYRDPIGKRNANKNDVSSSVEENGKIVAAISATDSLSPFAALLASSASPSTVTSTTAPMAPTFLTTPSGAGSSRLSSLSQPQHFGIGGIGICGTGAAASSSLSTVVSCGPSTATSGGLLHVALPQPIRPAPLQQPHQIDVKQPQQQQQSQQTMTGRRATTEAPAIALLPYAIPLAADPPSVLQRLVDGYRNFQSSQKSLYTVMYPDNIFAGETYRLVKHSEYVKMERGCISLMYSMLIDCFQPFDSLDQPIKVAALRVFSNRFTHLDQCYRTVALFPATDDPRFVVHYGQYISIEKLEDFFGENENIGNCVKSCTKTLQRCRAVVVKMRDMAVRDVEIAALAAIILWNELSYMSVEGTDRVRGTIFAELHNNMILTYGIATTGLRLGSLMDLIHDMNLIEKEIRESVIISKFFNPNFAEVWDDA